MKVALNKYKLTHQGEEGGGEEERMRKMRQRQRQRQGVCVLLKRHW